MLDSWLDEQLVAALAGLSERYRRPIVLHDLQGLTYNEVAQTLGCPVGTVMSRLHRGRGLLREALAHLAEAAGVRGGTRTGSRAPHGIAA
jgi:RNA polymerase sigma-70 factor (ECF subfamily)